MLFAITIKLWFQGTLYFQIVRWFQNHSYNIKRACGEVKTSAKKKDISVRNVVCHADPDEDDEAVQRHLKELNLEWKKTKSKSTDKVVRLFSLTHKYRSSCLLEKPTTSRVTVALENYPMIRKPAYVRLSTVCKC